MNMPLHQISAIPSQDATSARVYRSKTKEKEREEQVWREMLFLASVFLFFLLKQSRISSDDPVFFIIIYKSIWYEQFYSEYVVCL